MIELIFGENESAELLGGKRVSIQTIALDDSYVAIMPEAGETVGVYGEDFRALVLGRNVFRREDGAIIVDFEVKM